MVDIELRLTTHEFDVLYESLTNRLNYLHELADERPYSDAPLMRSMIDDCKNLRTKLEQAFEDSGSTERDGA